MTGEIASGHEFIILDACCVITLHCTGKMAAILGSLPRPVAIADYVHDTEILQVDLEDLVARGLLVVVSAESDDELNTLVNLAAYLDDGEAITGAIGIHRNWAIATDDKKALSLFTRVAPQIELVSTLSMIKYWADATNQKHKYVQAALHDLYLKAPYEPKSSHPLYSWWKIYIS